MTESELDQYTELTILLERLKHPDSKMDFQKRKELQYKLESLKASIESKIELADSGFTCGDCKANADLESKIAKLKEELSRTVGDFLEQHKQLEQYKTEKDNAVTTLKERNEEKRKLESAIDEIKTLAESRDITYPEYPMAVKIKEILAKLRSKKE